MYSMKTKAIVLIILALVAGQFMLGCSNRKSTSSTSKRNGQVYPPTQSSRPYADTTWSSSTSNRTNPDLDVSNIHWETDPAEPFLSPSPLLCGTVANNTDKTYFRLLIEFGLYNNLDQQVGEASTFCHRLEPSGTWLFRAHAIYNDLDYYPGPYDTKPKKYPTKYKVLHIGGFELSNVHLEKGKSGLWYVCGTVRNMFDSYSDVVIEVNLYDDLYQQVGNTVDTADNLEPGGTWQFRALVTEERATRYKIVDVWGIE